MTNKNYAEHERHGLVFADGHMEMIDIDHLRLPEKELSTPGLWTQGMSFPAEVGAPGTAEDRWFRAETPEELSWGEGSRRGNIYFR